MVLLPLAKAGLAVLLFAGLMAMFLSLTPHASPAVPEPSSSTTAPPPSSSTASDLPAPSPPPLPMSATIELRGTAFVNGSVTVGVGATIHWVHQDGMMPHSVTADDGSFDSSPQCVAGIPVSPLCMTDGNVFDQKFTKAGKYGYHCKVHPGMVGTITVA